MGVWAEPARAEISLAEVRAIAKEAYIYGFPLVDNYRVIYAYSVDRQSPEYKAPFNQIKNMPRVYTPDDRAVQTPNSDTPYSMLAVDLRAEPIVLTLPRVEKGRYFSVQLIDLYTFNFDYLGSRTTGNDGGSFLIAGPNWNGPTPAGIKKVLRSETELALAAYRTQLFGPSDLENVQRVQAGYKVEPLSAFLGVAPPPPAPPIDFLEPLSPAEERTSPEFFNELAFLLQFCPTHPSEAALRARFAEIGIVPGRPFGVAFLSAGVKSALAAGMADGQEGDRRAAGRDEVVGRSVRDAGGFAERLYESGGGGAVGHLRQLEGGGVLHSHADGYGRAPAQRRASLPADVWAGAVAAGEGVLVAHDVLAAGTTFGGQLDRPLSHQLADAAGLAARAPTVA